MRKIIAMTFVSLDGVMQSPGAPDEDPDNGFDLGGWTVPYWDDAANQVADSIFTTPYDLLLGRRTYDIFAAYWPHVERDPSRPGYNESDARVSQDFDAVTKYVATRDPGTLTWQHTRWLGQNVVQAVRELKERDGSRLLVPGSGQLVRTLLEHRLLDELALLVFPLVLGKGKRLFDDRAVPTAFEVTDTQVTSTGVVCATYTASGAVRTGTFAGPTAADTPRERRDRPHA